MPHAHTKYMHMRKPPFESTRTSKQRPLPTLVPMLVNEIVLRLSCESIQFIISRSSRLPSSKYQEADLPTIPLTGVGVGATAQIRDAAQPHSAATANTAATGYFTRARGSLGLGLRCPRTTSSPANTAATGDFTRARGSLRLSLGLAVARVLPTLVLPVTQQTQQPRKLSPGREAALGSISRAHRWAAKAPDGNLHLSPASAKAKAMAATTSITRHSATSVTSATSVNDRNGISEPS